MCVVATEATRCGWETSTLSQGNPHTLGGSPLRAPAPSPAHRDGHPLAPLTRLLRTALIDRSPSPLIKARPCRPIVMDTHVPH